MKHDLHIKMTPRIHKYMAHCINTGQFTREYKNYTNKVFGNLTVLRPAEKHGYFVVECRCGAQSIIRDPNHNHRKYCSQKCPLLLKARGDRTTTHGMRSHRANKIWLGMRARCSNPNELNWAYYGGRGISVCEAWDTFESFWADMGESYRDGLQLDRIDNNGNYCAANCRWVTRKDNCNNRRSCWTRKRPGLPPDFLEQARARGLIDATTYGRLRRGMAWADILSTPVVRRNKS